MRMVGMYSTYSVHGNVRVPHSQTQRNRRATGAHSVRQGSATGGRGGADGTMLTYRDDCERSKPIHAPHVPDAARKAVRADQAGQAISEDQSQQPTAR